MDSPKETEPAVETSAAAGARPSGASRLVATVISALVYGALVYISRFTPHLFGLQLVYPAVAVGPAFGIWFQFWGGLGLVLGTIVSQLPAGLSPLIWIPANLAQALYAFLPALLYKRVNVDSPTSWLRFIGICIVADALVQLVVIWNLDLNHYVPFGLGIRTIFPASLLIDTGWMAILGPVILNVVSPYVVKSGLLFRRFF
jgi:hypothetical protein